METKIISEVLPHEVDRRIVRQNDVTPIQMAFATAQREAIRRFCDTITRQVGPIDSRSITYAAMRKLRDEVLAK